MPIMHHVNTVKPNHLSSGAPVPFRSAEADQETEDSRLETRIRGKLLRQLGPGAFNIWVAASDGMVVLSGSVPEPDHREWALRITRDSNGVAEVHDLLAIKCNKQKILRD